MKILDESKLEFCKFSEVPVGFVFTRISTGQHHLKISTSTEKDNSIVLGGTSTWLIPVEEIVLARDATLVIK